MLEHTHQQPKEASSMMKRKKQGAHLVPSNKEVEEKEEGNQNLQTTRAKRIINFYPKCHVFWPSTMFELAEG